MKRMVNSKSAQMIDELAAKGGYVNDQPIFDNLAVYMDSIIDRDGNKRFQQFEITFNTSNYGQAFNGLCALSGKVLSIVGIIDRQSLTSSIAPSGILGLITLPQWIHAKVYPWVEGGTLVRSCSVEAVDLSLGNLIINIYKDTGNRLRLEFSSDNTETITQSSSARAISFEINLIIE